MNAILKTIISSTWAIRESAAIGYMPIVEKMMSGVSVDLSELKSSMDTTEISHNGKTVAVIPIHDVITKYDFCGDAGTMTFERQLKEYIDDSQVGAIILDFDTPGGESSYLENFSNTVYNSTKPVIAYYSGQCCSAGYYMASNCHAIFASAKSDEVGSIGTMCSFYAPNAKKQSESPYILHTVYATKSTDKNRPFREGQKGQYDLIRTSVLDPVNDIFHQQVQRGREDVSADVFSGTVYYSEDAMKHGLIDGIKTFEEVLNYAFDLIDNDMKWPFNRSKKQNQNNNNMKHLQKFSKILGREIKAVSEMTDADWAKVSASLPDETTKDTDTDPETETTETETETTETETETETTENPDQTQNNALANQISAAVTAAMAPFNNELQAVKQQLAKIGGQPGAKNTTDPITTGDKNNSATPSWANPDSSINQKADRDLGRK